MTAGKNSLACFYDINDAFGSIRQDVLLSKILRLNWEDQYAKEFVMWNIAFLFNVQCINVYGTDIFVGNVGGG